MDDRCVHVWRDGVLALSRINGRDVSSEPSGIAPMAPAQTLLYFADHKTPSDVTFHNGAIAAAVPVQLLFWGDFWSNAGTAQRADIEAKVQELLAGPYFGALDQYGVAPPVYGGARMVTQPGPPTDPFDGGDVSSMVWDLINDNVFPEPDDPGGRNAYFAMMPPGTRMAKAADGAHTSRFHLEPLVDVDWAWVAWANYHPETDTMLATFSHEMVELTTDPEPGGGWYNDQLDHGEGELADLCQPDGRWQTAYVGNVKVMAYWSARDKSCVVPTHPLKVRIDGRINVDAVHPDGSGDQESPFGVANNLCVLLPACCFTGPYHWTRQRVDETADLRATPSGYHAASLTWMVNDKVVAGQGSLDVTVGVTRANPTGPTYGDEKATLRYRQNGENLKLTNDSLAGSFDVTVSVVAKETDTSATGGVRTAKVVLPFRGQTFDWDDRLQQDQKACQIASDNWWKATHKATPPHVGPVDPGDLRPRDRAMLAALGAWVQPRTVLLAKRYLLNAQLLEADHPQEAAQLRTTLLSSLGLPWRSP